MSINCHKKNGFTLVELLVVMAILGILVTLVAAGFYTAQMRGRDAKRKSDLKEVANALSVFYSDHNRYPDSSGGQIQACSYIPDNSTSCTWGSDEFRDSATTYFKILPEDPTSSQNYVYRVPGGDTQKFQLYAHLENTRDPNCLPDAIGGEPDCETPDLGEVETEVDCGEICNFSVTSANAAPTDP